MIFQAMTEQCAARPQPPLPPMPDRDPDGDPPRPPPLPPGAPDPGKPHQDPPPGPPEQPPEPPPEIITAFARPGDLDAARRDVQR